MECTPAKPLSRSSLMTDKTLKKLQEKLLLRVSGPKLLCTPNLGGAHSQTMMN